MKDEENLSAFWKVIIPDVPEDPKKEPLPSPSGELTLQMNDRVLVRIRADGSHEFGPDYTPDFAAQVFWQAIAKSHPNAIHRPNEIEAVTQETMRMLMTRLGRADIHCEASRIASAREDTTDRDTFVADLALRNLEVEVHRVIEFARGLVEREATPTEQG